MRYAIVVAHPGDETLGAGGRLCREPPIAVVHATDGAPRDRRLLPPGLDVSPARYAGLRREELYAALAIGGVPVERALSLDAVEQEAALELPRLVEELVGIFVSLRIEAVITHAYEGGHPDHDSIAFAIHAAAACFRREGAAAPRVIEAALYHGCGGRFTAGGFLPRAGAAEAVWELSPGELARKRAMLACFASRRRELARSAVDEERFRAAPAYDFTKPPHEGALRYEQLGWPLTGGRFRALVRDALRSLDLGDGSWR